MCGAIIAAMPVSSRPTSRSAGKRRSVTRSANASLERMRGRNFGLAVDCRAPAATPHASHARRGARAAARRHRPSGGRRARAAAAPWPRPRRAAWRPPQTAGIARPRDRRRRAAARAAGVARARARSGAARRPRPRLGRRGPRSAQRRRSGCSASTNGWCGVSGSASQRPYSTIAPSACARRPSSVASRVLPTPGSPHMQHHLARARARSREMVAQRRQFLAPSSQRLIVATSKRRRKRNRIRASRVPDDLACRDRRGEALERHVAQGAEAVASARAHDATAPGGGQDLAALRRVAQAPRDHDRSPEVVVLVANRIADVQTDPHAQPQPRLAAIVAQHRPLHRHRATDGTDRAAERHHQSVAEALDLVAAARGHDVTQQPEVRAPQPLGLVVADPFEQLGRADQIGEQAASPCRPCLKAAVEPDPRPGTRSAPTARTARP